MIAFKNVAKSFGPKAVLEDVSFDVARGEVFFIIGASGVGKSVLIKQLVGLLIRIHTLTGPTRPT